MESPVVVDKPPEYGKAGSNDRGFPFDEEEGSGAWSELAARHPDIAARLRQRPATATWARKRRPSSQDADDFGESFSGFDRFPFDDIPSDFREHFPTHWNRRFGPREEPQPHSPTQQQPQAQPQPQTSQTPPQQTTAATQTEHDQNPPQEQTLPQYGLRNTVDLGQKSPADPSLVDADDRNQRSVSAPPDSRSANQPRMNAQNHQEQPRAEQSSNVRVIPIVVEGRDEPVINKSADHGTHFGENKPAYAPPPQQPHIDRDQYFADDGPIGYTHPPNFTRSFGSPYGKFRQGPQPFVHQKVYPQSATAFARGASPQRSQSPKPQHQEEHFVKVPVHHEQAPKPETPSRQQQRPPQQQQPPKQAQQPPPPQPQQPEPRPQSPSEPKPQPSSNDPITQILSIQTDVLNLMTDVENFKGTKKDKYYLFLDEMLTRNLIKLDNIETDGKENIRLARKEAIRCIQKCIAVLEAKADKGVAARPQEETEPKAENGEVVMSEPSKEEAKVESQSEPQVEEKKEDQPQAKEAEAIENKVAAPQTADTRPEAAENTEAKPEGEVEKKVTPKKGGKTVKKRDKSKDNKDTPNDSSKDEKVEDKAEDDKKGENQKEKLETMQVDDKGDKPESQAMEVDAPSQ